MTGPTKRERIEAEIARLAQLSPLDYEIERRPAADCLDIRPAVLDGLVKAQRPKSNDEKCFPHWKVKPSAEPVSTDGLLRQIAERLKQHVIFSNDAASAVALWLAFAWAHDAATHSPILLVTSAERDSGKTTLLGLVNFLSPRGLMVTHLSPAVLFRSIEKWNPTLIVDEADDQFQDNPPLRAVINGGWTRGAGVPRCHPDTHEPEFFPTFGPKAIGMKGRALPDTLLSRAIVIEMVRKKPGESVADFEHVDDPGLNMLRQQLKRWAGDNQGKLAAARPTLPDGFQNRLAANWRPLLAIAELAGGHWPKSARAAAEALTPKEASSVGTTLLGDIRAMFAGRNADRLTSSELVETLHTLEDRPWAEWGRSGKPISKIQIARILKDFKIYPDYCLNRFAEAFARYLDPPGGIDPQQRNNTDEMGTSGPFRPETEESDVAGQKCEKPPSNGQCCGVAGQNGGASTNCADAPICQHCGAPATAVSPVQLCAVNGEEVLLHPACQADWLGDDLSIPPFLQRT
jgi:putative DNA primase/helicase